MLAVAVSGMVPAVVPLDRNRVPLRRAIFQNDARARAEVTTLAAALHGVDLVTMTGSALTPQSVAPTTAWLRTHEPDVHDRTAHYVGSYDWMLTALGADVHVEQNWVLESGLFTIDGDVAEVVLTAAGLDAVTSSPAEVLCLPYFLGEKSPIHDPDLRGVFAGMHLGHTRADLYRSVLEAIAFGFRHHVDVFTDIGIAPTRVMITNGGSKSTLWKQIHADVLGIEMRPVRGHSRGLPGCGGHRRERRRRPRRLVRCRQLRHL